MHPTSIKFAAIFKHSPWLMQSDNAVHLPVSGMPKDHQVLWKDIAKWLASEQLRAVRADSSCPQEKK